MMVLSAYGIFKGCLVFFFNSQIYIIPLLSRSIVLLSNKNINFCKEIVDFHRYFCEPISTSSYKFIKVFDFSRPSSYLLPNVLNIPLWFPSVPEPTVTTDQYLSVLDLKSGENVIDLGAYSGISSIVFKKVVGQDGTVIAVEADPFTFPLLQKNCDLFASVYGSSIHTIHAACHSSSGFIDFISEGTPASSAIVSTEDIWIRQELIYSVRSITLSDLVTQFALQRVDVIKADIEGSEFAAFSDRNFFKQHRPRILMELPVSQSEGRKGKQLGWQLYHLFSSYDYEFKLIEQIGSSLLCVLFTPKEQLIKNET